MAVEDIGVLVPTKIPGLADAADIQEALRVYHYGGTGYEATAAQTSLPAVGIARRLLEITDDITSLENRPSSGGDVATTAPVAGSFTPSGIPNGYIWVDSDGTLGGGPTGATAVFTNSAPTTSITTGTIWVDKDSTDITANPFIPTATINAKGDLLVGSANDSIVTLSAGTNGFALAADSSTTSGLVWTDTAASAQTLTNKTISLGSNTVSMTLAQLNTAVSDADMVSLAGSETLTNKTLTTPVITNPKITLTYSAKTAAYTAVSGDEGGVFSINNAASVQFNIPTDATFNFAIGTQFNVFWLTGAGQPTMGAVTPGTTTIISTGATSATPALRVANSMATCLKIAANFWVVTGDVA